MTKNITIERKHIILEAFNCKVLYPLLQTCCIFLLFFTQGTKMSHEKYETENKGHIFYLTNINKMKALKIFYNKK
jgi:hypothetical protein